MIRRVAVRGVVMHKGKLLCARLKPYRGSLQTQQQDYWCIPGGGLEDGEALVKGVEREMLEETGIKPNVGSLLYIQQFQHNDREYLELFFHITNDKDYLDIDLSKTTHGEIEIHEISFIEAAQTHILPAFLKTVDIERHIMESGPVQIFYYN